MAETPQIVVAAGAAEFEIRRSRFLAFVHPCASPDEAAALLAQSRALHPKATHHVWAWRLFDPPHGIAERCDDDGEPGGTAGRPTLQALQSRAVVQALALTVRYFGGVKLGAGGLVRAYGSTANAAVSNAGLQPHVPMARLRISAPYPLLGTLESALGREELAVLERRFDPDPVLVCKMPLAAVAALEARLQEAGAGRITVEVLEEGEGNER